MEIIVTFSIISIYILKLDVPTFDRSLSKSNKSSTKSPPLTGPLTVSLAGPSAVSVARPSSVSVTGPSAVSVPGPSAVSVAGPSALSVDGPSPVTVPGPFFVSIPGPSVTSAATLMENYRYLHKLNHCKVGSFMYMSFLIGSKKCSAIRKCLNCFNMVDGYP